MTLKEEVYQAVHDYLKDRVQELTELEENNDDRIGCIQSRLIELLKVQRVIYKKFADYNERLAQDIKPVRLNTNDFTKEGY